MNITDFLHARIADDEAAAGTWYEDWRGNLETLADRVRAECAAKRRIVALETCLACEVEAQPCDHRDSTLRLMAAVYRDHPDYQEDWKP